MTGPGHVAIIGHTSNCVDVHFVNSLVSDINRWAFQI